MHCNNKTCWAFDMQIQTRLRSSDSLLANSKIEQGAKIFHHSIFSCRGNLNMMCGCSCTVCAREIAQ